MLLRKLERIFDKVVGVVLWRVISLEVGIGWCVIFSVVELYGGEREIIWDMDFFF